MENLNVENLTNEIQSLIKALKDCGGWVKRGNSEGWFNHEILGDALALITSQEQRIKELEAENEQFRHEQRKLIEERDAYQKWDYNKNALINSMTDKIETGYEPSAAQAVAEAEMWQRIALHEKRLTEENERLKCEVSDLKDELKCEKETKAHLCIQYRTEIHLRHQVEEILAKVTSFVKTDTVQKMQHKIWLEFSDCHAEDEICVGSFRASVYEVAKEMLEGENEVSGGE